MHLNNYQLYQNAILSLSNLTYGTMLVLLVENIIQQVITYNEIQSLLKYTYCRFLILTCYQHQNLYDILHFVHFIMHIRQNNLSSNKLQSIFYWFIIIFTFVIQYIALNHMNRGKNHFNVREHSLRNFKRNTNQNHRALS